MSQPKTRPNAGLSSYLASLSEIDRILCNRLIDYFQPLAASVPMLWGDVIVGFGLHNDWPIVAFALRKRAVSLYLSCSLEPYKTTLDAIPGITYSVGCIYAKSITWELLEHLRPIVIDAIEAVKGSAGIREYKQ
jgi:hypothetical protein